MLVVRNTSAYGFGVTSRLPFPVAVEQVKEVFAEQGFRFLSQIDMRDLLCNEIGASIPHYTILSFVLPQVTFKALQDEMEIGLLTPLNVLVRAQGPNTIVSVINPYLLMRLTENNRLRPLSDEVYAALEQALTQFAAPPVDQAIAA